MFNDLKLDAKMVGLGDIIYELIFENWKIKRVKYFI